MSQDGQRFLVNVSDTDPSPIGMILNWTDAARVLDGVDESTLRHGGGPGVH